MANASGPARPRAPAAPPLARRAPLYGVGWIFFSAVVRLGFGLRVEGRQNVPRTLGCIVASNHVSSWDPPVVGISAPRTIHFMAKRELFASRFVASVLRAVGAFPVDRSANDIGAVKEALRRLKAGHVVGIFFEGTRHADAKAVMGGAAFLAQRANVPIVPAAIWREGRSFRVRFGEPLVAEGTSRDEGAAITTELAVRVRAMLPEGQDERPVRTSS
ncbi:lysophospholipid acyltransferase family protein [soil metagenome]